MRSRSLSRSSANEEGTCRPSLNEINAQGAELGAPGTELSPSFSSSSPLPAGNEGKRRAVSPRRYGQRKVGRERHGIAQRRQKGSFVLVCELQGEFCHSHILRRVVRDALPPLSAPPLSSTPNRNSFHPFSRTCCSPSLRNIVSLSLSLSLSRYFHPRRFVFSALGRISPRDHA